MRRSGPLALLLFASLTAGPAFAEEPAPERYDEYQHLREHYDRAPSLGLGVRVVDVGCKSDAAETRVRAARLGRRLLASRRLAPPLAELVEADVHAVEADLGRLTFRGHFVHEVHVDGELVDQQALSSDWDVLPGEHLVQVGWVESRVRVEPGAAVVVDAPRDLGPAPLAYDWSRQRPRWPAAKLATEIALVSCTASALVGGLVLLVTASGEEDDARDPSRSPASREEERSDASKQRALGIVSLAIGGACAAGALAVPLVWKPGSSAQTRVTVSPFGLAGSF